MKYKLSHMLRFLENFGVSPSFGKQDIESQQKHDIYYKHKFFLTNNFFSLPIVKEHVGVRDPAQGCLQNAYRLNENTLGAGH